MKQPPVLAARRRRTLGPVLVALLALGGCAASSSGSATQQGTEPSTGGSGSQQGGSSSGANGGSGATGDIQVALGGSNGQGVVDESPWPAPECESVPSPGSVGAYCRGPAVDPDTPAAPASEDSDQGGCGTTLWGIVRDFHNYDSVPDLGVDFNHYCCNLTPGMVADELGADDKPVYTGAGETSDPPMTTDQAHFDQWYRDVDGVNLPFYVAFHLAHTEGNTYTFAAADKDHQYFPLDEVGWGNEYMDHNYSFTTELHTRFVYQGGEVFTFTGDDDLWVFINRKLAIDLGGIHIATTQTVDLDASAVELGLSIGGTYDLALFGAERHLADSNFRVDTSLTFVNCGVTPPIVLK